MGSKIFFFPKKSQNSVGIELGGYSLKMVEIRQAGGKSIL
jgi:Tfp pilus assembly PilM family ATPase